MVAKSVNAAAVTSSIAPRRKPGRPAKATPPTPELLTEAIDAWREADAGLQEARDRSDAARAALVAALHGLGLSGFVL